jgi:hypothetical protein
VQATSERFDRLEEIVAENAGPVAKGEKSTRARRPAPEAA